MRIFSLALLFLISCSSDRDEKPVRVAAKKGKIIATIDYKFQGCFGGGAEKLAITDNNGQMNAVLSSENGFEKIANINDAQVKAFFQFIKELQETEFGSGCTTTAHYKVSIGMAKIDKTDGGCQWEGYPELKRFLFL